MWDKSKKNSVEIKSISRFRVVQRLCCSLTNCMLKTVTRRLTKQIFTTSRPGIVVPATLANRLFDLSRLLRYTELAVHLRPLHSSPISFTKRRMPPKKKQAEEKRPVLGRPGNNLKVSQFRFSSQIISRRLQLSLGRCPTRRSLKQIGIVGLPNVGKSSFFNCLSQTSLANAQNYPYATM